MSRIVCWYSHGAASLVAAKLAIEKNKGEKELLVVCIHLENELQEPEREREAEKWLGVPITYIQDTKYGANVDTVIEKTRYMAGVYGARCTKELKKQVRFDWQKPDDIHVFGMTAEEAHRVDRILDAEPELSIWAPLIEENLTKEDCFKMMNDAGLTLPKMYLLGYNNNNCIGCLKAGGAGYWNKIRVDFPEVFERRSAQEKLLNVTLVKMSANKISKKHPEVFKNMEMDGYEPKIDARGTCRIPLRYLPSDAGSHKELDIGDCGFFCEVKD
jgi:phage terminase large subunit-like protein